MTTRVILSAPIFIDDGCFKVTIKTLKYAKKWVKTHEPINFCTYSTVTLLGIEPAGKLSACCHYDQALFLKPNKPLEWGKKYTFSEMFDIGVTCYFIKKTRHGKG